MNLLVKKLKDFGCDVEKAIDRCVNDEDLYISLVEIFAQDENFALLGKVLAENNVDEAFSCAHTIKGVAANLELTPILNAVSVIVEKLRVKSMDGIASDYRALLKVFDEYKQLVS